MSSNFTKRYLFAIICILEDCLLGVLFCKANAKAKHQGFLNAGAFEDDTVSGCSERIEPKRAQVSQQAFT
jgi:hypothetical protein